MQGAQSVVVCSGVSKGTVTGAGCTVSSGLYVTVTQYPYMVSSTTLGKLLRMTCFNCQSVLVFALNSQPRYQTFLLCPSLQVDSDPALERVSTQPNDSHHEHYG